MHACTPARTHVCTYIGTYVMCACMHCNMCACICVRIYILYLEFMHKYMFYSNVLLRSNCK